MVGPYYFNSETIRKVDYYRLLDTYVQSGDLQFLLYAAIQEDRAPLLTIRAVLSLQVKCF